jgi:hypothetical protein
VGLTLAARKPMLAALARVAQWASIHDDDPGDTGQHEIATPRRPVEWKTTRAGTLALVTVPPVIFEVPRETTVRAAGFWSQAVGGEFFGFEDAPPESYNLAGTYTLTAATLTLRDD